jgi:hypothetical protein
MTKTEARRRVWERMSVTARADADLGDWQFDESDDEKDHARLQEACEHVSKVCASKARGGRVK